MILVRPTIHEWCLVRDITTYCWTLLVLIVRLVRVDDAFVCQLFTLIEELSNDVNDPCHYPVIRVLVSSSRHDYSLQEITDVGTASAE